MDNTIKVSISRFDPDVDVTPHLQEYIIPREQRQSVLQVLLYIYENMDPTIAFRFGCRFKSCGLCSLMVNGNPRLACLTDLEEGMMLEPLSHIPVLRDLVVDRGMFYEHLKELKLYIPDDNSTSTSTIIFEPKIHERLAKCAECLICLAQCPFYSYKDKSFGGPYLFVKLAALHLDPRNQINRILQAQDSGIEKCRQCKGCHLYCPMGINIYKDAILTLLSNLKLHNSIDN